MSKRRTPGPTASGHKHGKAEKGQDRCLNFKTAKVKKAQVTEVRLCFYPDPRLRLGNPRRHWPRWLQSESFQHMHVKRSWQALLSIVPVFESTEAEASSLSAALATAACPEFDKPTGPFSARNSQCFSPS